MNKYVPLVALLILLSGAALVRRLETLYVGNNSPACVGGAANQIVQFNQDGGGFAFNLPAQRIGTCAGNGTSWEIVTGTPDTNSGGGIKGGGSLNGSAIKSTIALEVDGVVYAKVDGDFDSSHHLGSWVLSNGEVHAVASPAHATTIAIGFDQYNLCIDTGTAGTTAGLPASPDTGRTYTVADCTGHATANPITLTPDAGNIDGSGTFSINKNWASWSGFYTGTIWKTAAYYPGP